MTFEGQYLTYLEYRGLGGTLDQTSFNLLEFEARRIIDERTQERLKDVNAENIPSEVKLCEYKIITIIEKNSETMNENASVKNVSSETIDGYSIRYLTPAEINSVIKNQNEEIDDLINIYLCGVIVNNEHILYLGVK